jgi:hypothetical protein
MIPIPSTAPATSRGPRQPLRSPSPTHCRRGDETGDRPASPALPALVPPVLSGRGLTTIANYPLALFAPLRFRFERCPLLSPPAVTYFSPNKFAALRMYLCDLFPHQWHVSQIELLFTCFLFLNGSVSSAADSRTALVPVRWCGIVDSLPK